jgi:hypothetical protein
MTDIRETTDVRERDPAEMAGVVGGDDYCGTVVPVWPFPRPTSTVSLVSVTNVLPAARPAGGTIGLGF